ncbi:MAG: methyltransferase domain-containing protein [Waddliaceae bacterium]|jgi:SAM-dependent methyltransferase|nr:methyltransferase domain-containing protein [Waddliaceae bacterium]MBT4444639.1 methyltransferase domain-containing protein [Waddliaceae bacterium]MBT7265215.1 methyltransferase domain-containing protein [Waddliaceae bacterium]MBT7461632.1 methyltransferase domain-containing protein [Waddliaceae bacterium]
MIQHILDYIIDTKTLWDEGYKIPWNEPGFSKRILEDHLSQEHDMASRRDSVITKQAQWIHDTILKGKPSQILDLGCGPGLYIGKLTALGHTCTGIDFSPASIQYAQKHGSNASLGDIRTTEYPNNNDLVMLVTGELNAFSPEECKSIIKKACEALKPGGALLIEASTFGSVKASGNDNAHWFGCKHGGLFSEKPYLCLIENEWFDDVNTARSDFWILEDDSEKTAHYISTTQAYSDEEYKTLLKDGGFADVTFHSEYGDDIVEEPGVDGDYSSSSTYQVITAEKKDLS